MTFKTCKKVCKECPFRKDSLPGWLGPSTVQEFMDAQQFEVPFSCHMHRGDDPMENETLMYMGEIPICRGFLISATLSCKSFGQRPVIGAELAKLQQSLVITNEEKELILDRQKFREHHTIKK